jgi:phage baseplate assembly protein W
MADIPHFALPFRFSGVGAHAVVVDQDTIEDITNCVQAVLLTRRGERLELPDFGIDDPTFQALPIRQQDLIDAILRAEPRAYVIMSQAPDRFDALVTHVATYVSLNEGVSI